MDDKDKNVIEQIVDKINDVVETVATVAADALSQAIEPDPVKSDQQPISEPTMPLMPVHAPIKRTTAKKAVAAKSTVSLSGRITPTYEFPTPDSTTMLVSILPTKKTKKDAAKKRLQKTAKKPMKKSPKKAATKSGPRKSMKTVKKPTEKKVAKKKKAKR